MILANGVFRTPFAKTAHGLVRGPCRYRVVGVIDDTCTGEDAGEVLDGRWRDIPVVLPLGGDLGELVSAIEDHIGQSETP